MTLTRPDFEFVCTVVRQRSGIVLEVDKDYLIENRLSTLARKEGLASVPQLVERVRGEPHGTLTAKLIEAMTTNETSFYRDVAPFDALRLNVLPELLARNAQTRRLTVWCGASSTGQEPYSLAILLREHFPQLATWDVSVTATDLSTVVLEQAKKGTYSQLEVNRGMPASLLAKYFRRVGAAWQVTDDVRSLVSFRPLNLLEPLPPMPAADLVMLRNVLIYFDVPTKKGILAKVRKVLKPGGYLFLGGAETTMGIDPAFERVTFGKASAYRHTAAVASG